MTPARENPQRMLLTVQEVAFVLGCGRTLVYELIGSRQLPVVKVGRLTRVPVAAVDDLVSRQLTEAISPPIRMRSQRLGAANGPSRRVMAGGFGQARLFDDTPHA